MPPAAQRADQLPELAPGLRVEAGRRLVQEEQLRPADDAERDVEPALLAAGERVGARAGASRLRPTRSITASGSSAVRVVAGEVPDHLVDRQLVELAGALQHDADPGPPGARRRRPDRRPARSTSPPSRVPVALQDLHRGGLAGAVRARAARTPHRWSDRQVDAVHGAFSPYVLRSPRTRSLCALPCRRVPYVSEAGTTQAAGTCLRVISPDP